MPGEGVFERTGCRIPQPDGTIIAPTCDSVSIGTKRYASDATRMPGEQGNLLIRLHIINPNTN